MTIDEMREELEKEPPPLPSPNANYYNWNPGHRGHRERYTPEYHRPAQREWDDPDYTLPSINRAQRDRWGAVN